MNRLVITDKANCTGCGACQNICPCDAISMQWDEEGFPYPLINERCIDCGQCIQVCPLINPLPTYGESLEDATVYAAWSNDEERRIQSTSGGLFSELALSVYETGGVVVGAVYDEAFMIHHMVSERAEDLGRLRQSKYAQSDIRLVFREIKQFLAQDRSVLFCGTPCQAAGLRAYLGGVPEKLLLCDFICRGINSPKAYAAYLKMLEQRHGAKVVKVQFKNKDKGWNQFHTKVTFGNGSVHHQDRNTDPFMQAYLRYNLVIRPCCHICKFKEDHRNVDLSLGDFWGVGKHASELDENKGTSVVLANTKKGKRAVEALDARVTSRVMSIEQVYGGNICLRQSVVAGNNRGRFLAELDQAGFKKAMQRYGRPPFITHCFSLVKQAAKKVCCWIGKS
ncbi:MAG: Coenzyme F420 hydrogenase/dehydrogenase, beta subunit C-terminal domain [Kiritimatiellaeota bacterium]|nr:Coenzyme F420 hydrogenase/dehydrogenase, beta subunit C-terminal domain [Kiritimatiellota bacterium]